MSPFKPFAKNLFDRFHADFRGDTPDTFRVCVECGGACEYSKVSSLLPGEAEYMAGKSGMDVKSFRDAYLDGLMVGGELLDVLKCSDPCPFLDKADFSCRVRDFKPVMCLIYPIAFDFDGKNWSAVVDPACPLARHPQEVRFFEEKGRKLVEGLNIPAGWLEGVFEFDEYDFDYGRMVEERDCPVGEYKVYTLEDLLKYRR